MTEPGETDSAELVHEEWIESANRTGRVVNIQDRNYAGYVETSIPEMHHHMIMEYSIYDRVIDVHGGITFFEGGWIGFDCDHAGDVCRWKYGTMTHDRYESGVEYENIGDG